MNNIILDINCVSQRFGTANVLHDINLKIVQGQFVALVGPSGCGKTTLLKSILGTCPPKEGQVLIDGEPVNGPNRNVGIVYQQYSLYDFLTCEDQVAIGPKWDQTNPLQRLLPSWRKLRKKHIEEARDILDRFDLSHAYKLYPSQLSGGMKQRVAIAQALVMKPKILLLDEPFGALDEATREDQQNVLLNLYQDNLKARKAGVPPPWTVIIITHELKEAFLVSDRIVGLSKNWKEGDENGTTLGATKIWDKSAPVYFPGTSHNFELFEDDKQLLSEIVLKDGKDPSKRVDRNEHVSFWTDLEQGVGTGVVMVKPEKA